MPHFPNIFAYGTFVLTVSLLAQHFSEYTLGDAIVNNGSYNLVRAKPVELGVLSSVKGVFFLLKLWGKKNA